MGNLVIYSSFIIHPKTSHYIFVDGTSGLGGVAGRAWLVGFRVQTGQVGLRREYLARVRLAMDFRSYPYSNGLTGPIRAKSRPYGGRAHRDELLNANKRNIGLNLKKINIKV